MLKFLAVIGVLLAAAVAAYFWFFPNLTPAQRIARFKEEMHPKGGPVFETVLQGKPAAFLLMDCKVYILEVKDERVLKEKVLEPDFYPWFTACTSQTIKTEGEYVKVYLVQQAVGAGGGNVGGGNYRSKDGRNWEKDKANGWRPVSEPEDPKKPV